MKVTIKTFSSETAFPQERLFFMDSLVWKITKLETVETIFFCLFVFDIFIFFPPRTVGFGGKKLGWENCFLTSCAPNTDKPFFSGGYSQVSPTIKAQGMIERSMDSGAYRIQYAISAALLSLGLACEYLIPPFVDTHHRGKLLDHREQL